MTERDPLDPGRDESSSALRDELARFLDEAGPEECHRVLHLLEEGRWEEGHLCGRRLGDFQLERLLGAGGMGEVYEATQCSVPGRRVAVKVLRRGCTPALRRFAREIEVIGRLDHPHIVPVLSADLGHEYPHFAMKCVQGRTLAECIERRSEEERPDFGRIARWTRELALALEHSHRQQVVHRDVNPRNVLIDEEERAMLLDFGLARDETSLLELTHAEDAIGTPDYMAPEQIDSARGSVTARTDVYALGVTLYHALTGVRPFRKPSRHATLERILQGEAPAPRALDPRIPPDLQTICRRAMEPRPADRFASAGEMAEELLAFLEYRPIRTTPPSVLRRARWFARRHRTALAIAAALSIGLLSAIAYTSIVAPANEVRRLLAEAERAPALDPRRRSLLQRALQIDPEHSPARAAMAQDALARLRAVLDDPDPGTFLDAGLVTDLEDTARHYLERPQDVLLLDPRGALDLVVEGGVGTVEIRGLPAQDQGARSGFVAEDDPRAIALGPAPLHTELPEGSYLLVVRDERGNETRLPWLLRRQAVQRPDERSVRLSLPDRALVDAGFVHVPRGLALLGEPAQRRFVDPVYLQRRELCLDDLEGLVGIDAGRIVDFVFERTHAKGPRLPLPENVPGFADPDLLARIRGSNVEISPRQVRSAAIAQLREDELADLVGPLAHSASQYAQSLLTHLAHGLGEPDWPPNPRRLLLDLSINEIDGILTALNVVQYFRADEGVRYLFRLPTPDEWEYAARGADGRTYPWGNELDWSFSQNHRSTTDQDQHQDATHWPREDRSPFGVQDLAGSLQEPVQPPNAPDQVGLKRVVLRGGSRFSRYEEELRSSRSSFQGLDEHRFTTGLRLAANPLEDLTATATTPASFEEHFDTDSPDWSVRALRGVPVGAPERATVHDGRLLLPGYRGSFSTRLVAVHPLRLAPDHGRIRVRLRATADEADDREAWILVAGERWEWADLGLDAEVSMTWGGRVRLSGGESRDLPWTARDPTDLTIDFLPDREFEACLAPADGSHGAVTLRGRRARPTPLRSLAIGTGRLWGFQVELDEVEVDAGPDRER